MRAYFGLGLSLAVAGAITPATAFGQAAAPAAPAAPAAAPAAPAAPAAAAPAAPAEPAAPAAAAPEAATPPAPAGAEAAAPAAEEKPKPPPTITGFVEGAYHGNLSNMSNAQVIGRSYDGTNGNSFYLHAVHLSFNHSFSDQASVVADLDFGSDASITNYAYAPAAAPPHPHANSTMPIDIQEAYGVWSPDRFVVSVGRFVTYEGIEVIEGPLNPTITRGFLFGLAEPFAHVGGKVHYKITDQIQAGVGLVNGWDTMLDNNRGKTFIWALSAAPVDMFHAQFSGTYGPEQADQFGRPRLSLDLTGAVVLDPVTINFQGNFGREKSVLLTTGQDAMGNPIKQNFDDNWYGFGIQPVVAIEKFTLGGRIEYFGNKHGSRLSGNYLNDRLNMWNFTITPGYQVADGLTVRGELRLDTANQDIFLRNGTAGPQKTQTTFAVGAHYMF